MSDKLTAGASPLRGPLHSPTWNRVLESSDDYHDKRARGNPLPIKPTWLRNWLTVAKVRNDTGLNLAAGAVVEFDGEILAAVSTDAPWLSARIPDFSRAGFGVLLEPALQATPDVVDVAVAGVCVAHVRVTSANHICARREPNVTYLVSADRGAAKILAVGDETDVEGVFNCLVQLIDDLPQKYFGIVRDTFTQGVDDLVALDIYARDIGAGKWRKVPGFVLYAVDWYLQKDEVLEKGTKATAVWYYNCWAVDTMHCEPSDLEEFTASPVTGSPGEMEAALSTPPAGETYEPTTDGAP